MKKRIFIFLTIIIIPIGILLADRYILKDDIRLNARSNQGAEWDYIYEHQKEYPPSLLRLASRNPETIPFVANYLKESKKTHSMNIRDDLKNGEIPLLLQWDQRWGYKGYGDDMMAINGCGPTCLSMVVSYLKQDPTYHPYFIAKYALDKGYWTGESTSWDLMNEGARNLGLEVRELSLDEQKMIDELNKGNPIICSMSKGIFTTTGHFIVIKEYKDKKFYVNDPNSPKKSAVGYSFEEIQYQIKNIWAYNI